MNKAIKINGNGSTFKYGKMWRTELRYTDDSGRSRRKVFTGKTCSESRGKADDFIDENSNSCSSHINDTVTEFIEYYIDNIISIDNKSSSVLRCKQSLKNQIGPIIGKKLIKNIRTEDVQNMITSLVNKGYSHSTIKKSLNLFNAANRYYIGLGGKTHYSPALIKMPKPDSEEVVFFSENELDIMQNYLFSIIDKTRYAAALIILANTGLRVGELLALSKENVDIWQKKIYVAETASQVSVDENGKYGGKIHNQTTKTKSGKRIVVLNSDAVKAMEFILERDKNIDSEFLICTKNGNQVYQKPLNELFHKVLKETSLEKEKSCGVHSLRHSFATKLLNNNVSIETVSYILGHSTDSITKKYYIHDKEKRAVNELSGSPLFS